MYNIKQGLKNIWHNKMFSFASILTMAACIFLFGVFYSIGLNFSAMVREVEQGVAVTVFFEEYNTSDEEQIAAHQAIVDSVGEAIASRSEVESYNYVSAEEAWESYVEEHFSGNEALAEGFAQDNPLATSDNYQIYLNDVSKQEELVSYLEGLEGVRQVNQSEVAANTLTDFNTLLNIISIGVVALLIAISVFLISNTVTVGVTVRKEEIEIMQLIGAKERFIRAPFIVEGIVIGIIGAAIPLVILYFGYGNLVGYVTDRFQFLGSLMDFVPEAVIFRTLVPLSLLLGVGIGFIGSRFTVGKHLRKGVKAV